VGAVRNAERPDHKLVIGYADQAWVVAVARALVAPTDGHNVVVKTDCILELRNAWDGRPDDYVDDAECFADVKVAWDCPEARPWHRGRVRRDHTTS
jgi:hypothetical protein